MLDKNFSHVINRVDMGVGARVEIDFIDILNNDEGILVGDSAKGFVCILAETRGTETYPPRPFRVNAGAIHQYVYVKDNTTKYLSEIRPGDKILVTNGINERSITVGRVKIENREFERICLESGITATLQKADSVFLLSKDGSAHLFDITDKDMLAYFPMEDIARHKGQPIQESVIEI